MRSHVTAAMLVCAALLSAAATVAQTPATPGRAMKGTLVEASVPSTNVPAPVPITYYLPKDYDAKRAEPYPLLTQLHGGGLTNKVMEHMGGLLDQAIENTVAPPMVSVCRLPASFYMNFRDGSQKWEDFVMKDLLPHMRKNFNCVQGRLRTGSRGHVHHEHLDGRHGFAADGGEVSASLPGSGQPPARARRPAIGQLTIPPPSSRRTLRASWVVSTTARSSSIVCCSMQASAMNIAW
jgi:hypothetical protein